MSRTITALFDTREDAQAGCERLKEARVDADSVRIHDSGSTSQSGQSSQYSTAQEPGLWASIKNAFLPDEDRHTYEEGMRRGGYLLTADVDEDKIDDAVRALEDANGVDIDERAQAWRSEGWDYNPAEASGALFGGERDRDPNALGASGYEQDRDRTTMGGSDDDVIPIVEEQLVVGKREVGRGGVRVRSYVTETPMHEQVRLRQERVNIARNTVDRPLSDADADAFRERSIEMTETNEEAVVGKTARVVEEVSLNKTSDERVEDINETVRRTDVEIEEIEGAGRSDTDRGLGDRMAGLANEGLGNTKQGIGGLTGNDDLTRDGLSQERKGEGQQGKGPDRSF